jgi:hypothetical protein
MYFKLSRDENKEKMLFIFHSTDINRFSLYTCYTGHIMVHIAMLVQVYICAPVSLFSIDKSDLFSSIKPVQTRGGHMAPWYRYLHICPLYGQNWALILFHFSLVYPRPRTILGWKNKGVKKSNLRGSKN